MVKFCIDVIRNKHRGLKLVRRGFADKLYDICHILYGWDGFKQRGYYQENPQRKNEIIPHLNESVRNILIRFGNYMRAFDKDVWLNAALKTQDYDVLFVSDLRFPNEFDKVRELGGGLIRIDRPGLVEPTDEADTALNDYKSKWDDVVVNDKDHAHLYSEAERIVKWHLPQYS